MSREERYIMDRCGLRSEGLEWIERQTNLRTNYPQMLCGPVQGRLLKMLVEITGASRVLEIGAFTGYSAACMALGLPDGGIVDSLEINDELQDLILEGWRRTGVADRIRLHVGDALETIPALGRQYDLVFIDADKRQYPDYLEAVLPLVRKGGLIAADDVLLGGKVCDDPPASDAQTRGLLAFNEAVACNPELESVIIPIRDGLTLIRKR